MIEIIPNWHPLFVHFTVALFTLSLVFFIIQRPLAETEIGDNFLVFARYSLGLGILFTIGTVVAGFDAYNTVDHDTPSHLAMKDHRLWALITAGVFLLAWLWSLISFRTEEKVSLFLLVILLIGGGLLVTTGHKGSQLVYYYGLGVETLPETDEHDHTAHDHGEEAAGDHKHDAEVEHEHAAEAEHEHATDAEHEHADTTSHDHDTEATQAPVEAVEEPMEQSSDESKAEDTLEAPAAEHEHTDTEEHSHSAETTEPEIITDKDGIVRESLPEVHLMDPVVE